MTGAWKRTSSDWIGIVFELLWVLYCSWFYRCAERLTQVVSDLGSFASRTPEELRVRWVATEHPSINHGPWPAEELNRAKELVEQTPKGQTVNWVEIGQKLGVWLLLHHFACRANVVADE